MRRNSNLELRLVHFPDSDHHRRQPVMENESNESLRERQQLTIFYNGRVCVSDVTELQARAIMMLASREMEEKLRTQIGSPTRTPTGSEIASPTPTPTSTLPPQLCSPNTSLSMRRSIQHFLQKRKNRIQSASPYHN